MRNGLFSLNSFYLKLTLDHFAKERFTSFRYMLEWLMQRSGFYMTSARTHFHREKYL